MSQKETLVNSNVLARSLIFFLSLFWSAADFNYLIWRDAVYLMVRVWVSIRLWVRIIVTISVTVTVCKVLGLG